MIRVVSLICLLFSGWAQAGDIVDELKQLKNISFTEVYDPATPKGYRRFDIKITQKVDYMEETSPSFEQRLILLHVDAAAPMILQTSGYAIFRVGLSSPAKLFRANQIQVEHRFFDQSMPKGQDFFKLTVWQSANDFHRVVETFKSIYKAAWLNTGASKGGMTSIYHRRYFPKDLDGTLALVAPLSFSPSDERYVDFVANVGGDAYKLCREKLAGMQKKILMNRDAVLAKIDGSFQHIGGKAIAFEHAVLELPFAFWQYHSPKDVQCSNVPGHDATVEQAEAFLEDINDVEDGFGDTAMKRFMSYYYQAATELGAPSVDMKSILSLLKFPETYTLQTYLPKGIPAIHDPTTMYDVEAWLETSAERIMMVYGEFDPWTAGQHPIRDNGDMHKLFVPKGNHGADVTKLADNEQAQAVDILSRWLKAEPVKTKDQDGPSLEELEFTVRKRFKL